MPTGTEDLDWNDRRKMHRVKTARKDTWTEKVWLYVGRVIDALKATRDREAWKIKISYAKEQNT